MSKLTQKVVQEVLGVYKDKRAMHFSAMTSRNFNDLLLLAYEHYDVGFTNCQDVYCLNDRKSRLGL